MANSRKIKKTYTCPTCKGNGFLRLSSDLTDDKMIQQCWDCDSKGELYDYEEDKKLN
jgi:DnaJ-class molecular chaperone